MMFKVWRARSGSDISPSGASTFHIRFASCTTTSLTAGQTFVVNAPIVGELAAASLRLDTVPS
jgi:hypothetical protein